ncbi:hypothetical protein [Herbiconiux flava]|uniref:Uncharacterized protein n=1 Tax=Herbiconiux flava TaxID=881268 RepID=A0A852SQA4_9MICO|nr:hypothetical protein [Herbiconiux flava]NYD71017.1 hypothetical protein [Herbiconiux flava]GLK19019.1 hypothetical protein GCM10017602_35010 [Herbiconiux flava]
MNESRFDPERSAAIRSMLIQTVDAEPERARRVRLRVALATVLAAIGLTFGGTAVAVALSGGALFTVGAPAPVETTSAPVASTPTPTEVSRPEPTAPAHPLVVTGDRILPHDLVSAPASSPAWSIDLPVIGGVPGCSYDTITDVADGYALVQQTLIVGDTTPAVCDSSVNRMAVTLVDTAVGSVVWSREWSWDHTGVDSTTARLLGTSGRVLVWDPAAGAGPAEVLDLATGETLGPVTVPEGYGVGNLSLVTGDSGDVVYPAQRLDAESQRTTAWSIRRADPLDLGNPRWSHELEAEEVLGYNAPGNSSSIVDVPFHRSGGPWIDDVLDLDTGAVMASGVPDRSYLSFDGFTLRASGYTEHFVPSAVAGIDDAGNEVWTREDATGISIVPIDLPGQKPAAVGLNDGSEVALYTGDGRLELVDGITGETKWAVDAPGCVIDPGAFDRSAVALELQPDGVLFDPRRGCAFDHETGASVDPGGRREADLGSAVVYELRGGAGTGGRSTIDGVVPGSGTATTLDAVTGEELWTLPIASDERWWSAGGYIVGTSNGRMFGIG